MYMYLVYVNGEIPFYPNRIRTWPRTQDIPEYYSLWNICRNNVQYQIPGIVKAQNAVHKQQELIEDWR